MRLLQSFVIPCAKYHQVPQNILTVDDVLVDLSVVTARHGQKLAKFQGVLFWADMEYEILPQKDAFK